MISPHLPMGQSASQRLEFKSAAAIESPEIIGRAVVAMLNATGGDLWIGIGERDGRAGQIEEIPDCEMAKKRLLDHLVDTLEPSPNSEEIVIEPIGVSVSGSILKIVVRPIAGRQPYAQMRGGGRLFTIRIGDRARPMTREEIRTKLCGEANRVTGAADPLENAQAALIEFRRIDQEKHPRSLWLALMPVERIPPLDLQVPSLRDVLQKPSLTGNRPGGWHFANPYIEPRVRSDRLEFGDESWPMLTTIHESGRIVFRVPLDWEMIRWKGAENEIWPFAMLELPVSVFRLAKAVYETRLPSADSRVVSDLALFGARGKKLRRHSPRSIGYQLNEPGVIVDEEDVVSSSPLVFTREELVENPDRCAFRHIVKIYQAFGLREAEIPIEFDRSSMRLRMPD